MNTIRCELNEKQLVRKTPQTWNELSPGQLCFVAPRVMLAKPSEASFNQVLLHFLALPDRYLRQMNQSQLQALYPAVTWLWKENKLTAQLLPALKTGTFSRFVGPDDELKNITAAEFAFADKFLGAWLNKKEEKWLNYLVACLYRPAGARFDENRLDANVNLIAKISFDKRLAVAAFFIGCRADLVRKFPAVFNAPASDSKRKNRSGWLGFFYDMAGPKLGSYRDVSAMNLYELLFLLDKISEEAKEERRRAEQLKRRARGTH